MLFAKIKIMQKFTHCIYLQADFIDISRGNAFLFMGGRVSKTKKKPIPKPKKEVIAAQKTPKTPSPKKVPKGAKVPKEPKDSKKTSKTPSPKKVPKVPKVPKEPKEPKEKPKKVTTKAVSPKKVPKNQAKKVKPKEPKVKTTAPKGANKVNKVKKQASDKIKIVPKVRIIYTYMVPNHLLR